MNYYFAPLEGITDLAYRTVHHKYFGGVDRYYMPFLSPTQNHCLSKKEQRELPDATTLPCDTVPQILAKNAEDFLWAAQCCEERGYKEVNLNMGCPSGTVVAKGKGAGMLSHVDTMTEFLDRIFHACPLRISVKTRIGTESPEEFPRILEALEQYPIAEWVIHPRVRNAFYKGTVDGNAFRYAVAHSKLPLCYNGDICTREDIAFLTEEFPPVASLMLGRGLVTDPGLLTGNRDRDTLYAFHEELFDAYCRVFGDRRNAMCRMKEIWSLLIGLFGGSEQHSKKLKKCNDYTTFRQIATEILTRLPLVPPESHLREVFL